MRILFVITDLAIGGAEKQVAALAARSISKGNEVGIVSLVSDPEAKRVALPREAALFLLDMKPGAPDLRMIFNLGRIVRRFSPDVVHSHMIHANILARMTRLFTPMNLLVCTAHSDIETRSVFLKAVYRRTDFLCDVMTNVSESAVRSFIKEGISPRRKIRCIYDGVDLAIGNGYPEDLDGPRKALREELGLQPEARVIAYAGRLEPVKGADILAEAIQQIRERGRNDIGFVVFGDGTLMETMREKVEHGAGVKFFGMVHKVASLLPLADIFVMPSRNEGFGIALVEALAAGLYPIVSDCAGSREIVEAVGIGDIVERENGAALAEAILRAVDSSSRETVNYSHLLRLHERFDLAGIVNAWEKIYCQRPSHNRHKRE